MLGWAFLDILLLEGFNDGKMRTCLLGYTVPCGLSWAFCSWEASICVDCLLGSLRAF